MVIFFWEIVGEFESIPYFLSTDGGINYRVKNIDFEFLVGYKRLKIDWNPNEVFPLSGTHTQKGVNIFIGATYRFGK